MCSEALLRDGGGRWTPALINQHCKPVHVKEAGTGGGGEQGGAKRQKKRGGERGGDPQRLDERGFRNGIKGVKYGVRKTGTTFQAVVSAITKGNGEEANSEGWGEVAFKEPS